MADSVEPPGTAMPGRSRSGRLATIDRWWVLVLFVLVAIVLLVRTSPDPFGEMFQFLSDGIVVTLKITVTDKRHELSEGHEFHLWYLMVAG